MHSATKARAGKHGRGDVHANSLSHDAVKLLKTQDAGYLRLAASRGRRQLEKLEEEVSMDNPPKGGKIIFVEDESMDTAMTAPLREIETMDFEITNGASRTIDMLPSPPTEHGSIAGAVPQTTSRPQSKKAIAVHHKALHDLRVARKTEETSCGHESK
jgi:hypothetical protein